MNGIGFEQEEGQWDRKCALCSYLFVRRPLPTLGRLGKDRRSKKSSLGRVWDEATKFLVTPLYLGRGENEGAHPPPAPIQPKDKGILQRLKEVFWKPEEEEEDEGESTKGHRQKMH